jgi:hypothetical protein
MPSKTFLSLITELIYGFNILFSFYVETEGFLFFKLGFAEG